MQLVLLPIKQISTHYSDAFGPKDHMDPLHCPTALITRRFALLMNSLRLFILYIFLIAFKCKLRNLNG